MTTPATYPRPFGVALVSLLAGVGGLLSMAAGVALLLLRNDSDLLAGTGATSDQLVVLGLEALFVGLVYLFVARGLWWGSPFARFVVLFVAFLSVVSGSYVALTYEGQARVQGIASVAWALVLILLLTTRRARAFFRGY